jgi:predicted Zn-ribbon and HTH transcriptional regulator
MRVNYDYKSKEEWEQEKAQFMSLYLYLKKTEPEGYKDWFDKEAIDKYVHGKVNAYYNAQLKKPSYEKVSMVRVPTRCPDCKKAWAIELGARNKFAPTYLDPEVYNNIPLIKGLCHECKEETDG